MANLHKQAGWEKLLKHSPDILCAIDENGQFVQVSGSCEHILGYTISELEGKRYIDFVTPRDRELTKQTVQQILRGHRVTDFRNEYRNKHGKVVCMRWSAVWSQEDRLMFCIARPSVENQEQAPSAKDSPQRYKALFDNHPDVVFFEGDSGTVEEVNSAFREVFGGAGDDIIGKPALTFLPPGMAKVNMMSLEQALLGSTLRFDMQLTVQGKRKKVFDTVKFPVMVQGETVGALTVAKDITPVVKSYEQLERQTKELGIILESISDAFFALDKDWRFTYVNSVFAEKEGYSKETLTGKNIWEVFPELTSTEFYRKCLETTQSGVASSFEETHAYSGGTYRFKLYPSEEGLSVFFTDVTREKKMQQELEKLSHVASNTTNGVVIMDREFRIEWVNDGFSRLTGYSLDEALGRTPFDLLHNTKADSSSLDKVRHKMVEGKPVSFEILRRKKDGGDIWLLVQVNPVFDDKGGIAQYIFIQTDVTERVKAHKELEKLSLVASKTSNSVIIADKDWKIEWVNDGFTRMMGYTMEEAVGKRPVDLLHSPKTNKTSYELLEERMLRGEPISFEALNIRKDGEEVWVHVDISAVSGEDGKAYRYVVVQSDITALKKSEQELERLALVAKYTDNSVFITDAQKRTEWVNEAFTKSTGYTLAEVVGKDPKDVLGGLESDPQIVETIQENLKRGVSFSADIINYNKAGEKFWVTMDISPVYDSEGNLKRYIAIHRDITSKKEAEANLLQMTEDLYLQNSNLQQFTYIVSHNLRAPLANALGLASLLSKVEKSSSVFNVTLSHLRTNLVRIDTVLRDVNAMLSAREKQSVLPIERVGLSDVIGQALSYLQESLYRLGATVALDVDKGAMVNADRAYLFSVFYNLLTNAIKFRSPERPLNINIRHRLDTDGSNVVSFSDNGIGFDAERAGEDVFRFYKRFHRSIGGRGIGLFLVKTYMEAMGGRIEVESKENEGTKFMLYLP